MIKIIEKDIDDLIPYENNARINDKAVDVVANSIQEFGWRNPCIIDKNNVIVAGHTRVLAGKKLGIKKVPCIVADDLTEEQIMAFRLADNKTAEISEWDYNKLDAELVKIEMDMSQFNFDIKELDIDDYGTDFDLPDGDKSNIKQMTFTFSDEQATFIENLIRDVRQKQYFKDYCSISENKNLNGNALFLLLEKVNLEE